MSVTRLTPPYDATAADAARARASEALWDMTPAERVSAMWAGTLSYGQLCEWSARRPDEVPKLGGEFAWIMAKTPEFAEAREATQAKGAEELAA